MKRRSFLRAAIALGAGARAALAQARVQDDSRVALVIGNNAYPQVNGSKDPTASYGKCPSSISQ